MVGKSANKFTVDGETANAVPALTVAFAVAATFTASRTVISTTVSAFTEFATTVNVEPFTFVVIGIAPLLLEKAVYGLRPPVIVNVVDTPGSKSTVAGDTANVVPAVKSPELTAPLHEPRNTK